MAENLTKIIKQYATEISTTDSVIEIKKNLFNDVSIRRKLNYNEFDLLIDKYSTIFQKTGIKKSNRVLVLLRPSIEMMCVFFSLIRIGAIPIVIDTGNGLKKFTKLANFSKPKFIICSRFLKFLITFKFLKIQGKAIAVSQSFVEKQQIISIMQDMKPDDTVAILFTSGSTGAAKGVVYKHKNFLSQLKKLRTTYNLIPGVRDITLLPAFMMFNPMFGRTTIISDIDFSNPAKLCPGNIIKTIVNNNATSSFGAPILWEKIANHCIDREIKIHTLENIFLAGVSATTKVLEKIQNAAPNAKIFTPYGATECLPICSISAEEIFREIQPLQENGAGTCIGTPVAGIDVKIIKITDDIIENFNEDYVLSTGFTGEIIVSGGNITELYDQLEYKTKLSKIYDNGKIWHRMGDLGFFDQKGRVWFCGRKAERVITSTGEEYYPDCIEPLFGKYSKVQRAALIKYIKNKIILPAIVILPKEGEYPWSFLEKWKFKKELIDLAQRFPKTKNIKHFFFVKKLPVDSRHNSKIHRLTLSKIFSKK